MQIRLQEIIELPNNILTSDIPAQPAADVWTIGMTLLQLMDWRNFEVWGIVDYTRPRAEFPTLSQEAVDFYDADLVRLVHSYVFSKHTRMTVSADWMQG